jgi:hypothetical protein
MPIVAMSSHSTFATPPTTPSLSGRAPLAKRQLSNGRGSRPYPGGIGHDPPQRYVRRPRSASACASVTPGFSLATISYWKKTRVSVLRSNQSGTSTSGSTVTTRKPRGMTPTTFSERESLVNVRPTTEGSPPNLRCQ